ncbi:MAG: AAA family ATPase, partial [Clostridia bacterium]|nr:AAA family ATPase [Clostridia bacterium]
MRLISCYIANFGLHHDKKIDFNRGLNSFQWKNGEGKTTLTVFIKAMLYGFGDNRSDEERKKYMPWQGGKYGGSLTFEAGGKTYAVERTFGKKQAEDTFVLRDEKTGGVSNSYTENLGLELFGID